ncbi:hypothetical protein H6F32_17730 [Anabaena sp. FACHB-1237]|uniref:hypothetical protein n=1 Tax=Anabaena sp. FACHB-1237 TaxID=2692769 RepID=UPI0016808BA6|nr:hypothetical protein [Anabaena sp. FACHB-1237]MBD2139361.1 hypothetical protein [Anabaena sp. FACHB-1237]
MDNRRLIFRLILICAFPVKPYLVLYLNIVFILIKNFRIELYHWLCQRCQITVNKFLSRMPDDFRNQHQDTLLISAQNFLSCSSTEFAPELFIQDFDFSRYTFDESSAQIQFRIFTGYVDRKIKYQIFVILRELVGDTTIGHSNVGLAARTTSKRVQSSLERAGYNHENTEQYMFFFNRFKEVRTSEILPSHLAISQWKEDNYQLVADRYNEIKPETWESINGAKSKIMLEKIGQAIRDYERSPIASHTVSIDAHGVESTVISPEYDSCLLLDLCDFIRNLLRRLDGRSNPEINRRIIFAILNHGLDINQVEIAERYITRQYIVSRQLNRLYDKIAKGYFPSCGTEPSSEQLNLFIQLLKNRAVNGQQLRIPILKRIFVDEFEQIFSAYIVTSHTTINMKTDIMISKVQDQYNINLDEVARNYLSQWIRTK